ncbi:ATP-dependent DNA helicase RecG [Sulfuriferula plumbiphila]|uniref:ATP-dependent DNA helicase RecG n=1 Tax=Sulfuriferula plumbiphila TaxID=171865 RepID=A0A512L4R4_9PROT|nr:ATP-dependent DNA helicase RecG [Sulfuriferula plumbiphila]BBP03181.1 ATP-dependent DNA helicase RecG [Sulfuriferula plumbiphila]GEP29468.1 ATP-dependent DNA helicase RecG [Sulfuriferula plumbiphila]
MAAPSKPAGAGNALPPVFTKLGLHTPADLILHLPLRYEDETRISAIADALPGRATQVQGVVTHCEAKYKPRRALIARIRDDSGGEISLRFINFYGSQAKQFAEGNLIRALGEVRGGFWGLEMVHPRYRVVSAEAPLPDSLTPIYPAAAGVAQTLLRRHIGAALTQADLTDTLPDSLRSRFNLPDFASSVRTLHNPPPDIPPAQLEYRTHPAWRRIKFDELLAQQLSLRLARNARRAQGAPMLAGEVALVTQLQNSLPFRLTAAQQRVWHEIRTDLAACHPMQRLLQGDVGSGKTVVAALAAAQAIGHGYQAAFMAPTEILAEQHYHKLTQWFAPLGIEVAWLAGSLSKKDKQAAVARLVSGEARLAAGTHALFQEQVEFANLGLAIIDEQHRFGVAQRLALRRKGNQPHQLMMSATPIPRTLSMSYYADLDVSVIDELPPGRSPVVTKLLADSRREQVVELVRERCRAGGQVYWVCPLIEESEKLQLQTALDTHAVLASALPELDIGLVHGRMNGRDKAVVMAGFKCGDLQLLVATTVIEVGVDVPRASLMVIEHAERMGLAQLHQLRGRVGRGSTQSACILLYQQPLSDAARARLKVIFENSDGFVIAREDLRLRGPGEFLGARQSGAPMLRFADIEADADILEQARAAAEWLLIHDGLAARNHVLRWLGGRQDYIKT